MIETVLTVFGELAIGKVVPGFARLFRKDKDGPGWIAELVTRGDDPAIDHAYECFVASGMSDQQLDKPWNMRQWIDDCYSDPGRSPGIRDYLIVSWRPRQDGAMPRVDSAMWCGHDPRNGYLFISALGYRKDDPGAIRSIPVLYEKVLDLIQPVSSLRAVLFESDFPVPSDRSSEAVEHAGEARARLRSFARSFRRAGLCSCRLPVSFVQPSTNPCVDATRGLPLLLCAASPRWESAGDGSVELSHADLTSIVRWIYRDLYAGAFAREDELLGAPEHSAYQQAMVDYEARALAGITTEPPELASLMKVSAAPL